MTGSRMLHIFCSVHSGRHVQPGDIHAFQGQELQFPFDTACIACKAAICGHYAVAGDDNGNWIVTDCAADRLSAHAGTVHLLCGIPCELAVGGRFAIGDFAQQFPEYLSEGGSGGAQCQFLRVWLFTRKIPVKPIFSGGEHCRAAAYWRASWV